MSRDIYAAMRRLVEWEALEYCLSLGFNADQAYDAVKHPIQQVPVEDIPQHVYRRSTL